MQGEEIPEDTNVVVRVTARAQLGHRAQDGGDALQVEAVGVRMFGADPTAASERRTA